MMKLEQLEGAVVNFGLSCGDLRHLRCCKVIHVDEEEVIFIHQTLAQLFTQQIRAVNRLSITENDDGQIEAPLFEDPFVSDITVDYGQPIHMDRQRIVTWSYYRLDVEDGISYKDLPKHHEFKNFTADMITHFNNGICTGKN